MNFSTAISPFFGFVQDAARVFQIRAHQKPVVIGVSSEQNPQGTQFERSAGCGWVREEQQALAVIERRQAEIVGAQHQLRRAESGHESLHLAATRLTEVSDSKYNIVAQQELDDALSKDRAAEAEIAADRAALAAAQAALADAQASAERIRALIDYARITSPFAGVITNRQAHTGAMIPAGTSTTSQGMPLVTVAQDNPLRLVIPVGLKEGHRTGAYDYMSRVRRRLAAELPHLSAYMESGGRVEAVLKSGAPAPIDLQVSGPDLEADFAAAGNLESEIRRLAGVGDVFTPQDADYPALRLEIDRRRAAELGLSQREVLHNVITTLTSNGMINPGYWIDRATGNDYMLTVQYPEERVRDLDDLTGIPLRGEGRPATVLLDSVGAFRHIESPTEVDHYQIERVVNICVTPQNDLGRAATAIQRIIERTRLREGVSVRLRGAVEEMRNSFASFGFGLLLSVVLLYLMLAAQFSSFSDPGLVMLAVPPGITGVLLALVLSGSTLNIMSLMGVVMLVDLVAFNSILIVELAPEQRRQGRSAGEAALLAGRIRLRPILMTWLATIIGLLPMALRLGAGSESYAPLAWATVGGGGVCAVDDVPGPRRIPVALWRPAGGGGSAGGGTMRRLALMLAWPALLCAQPAEKLTFAEAEQIALRNHPRTGTARFGALAAAQTPRHRRRIIRWRTET